MADCHGIMHTVGRTYAREAGLTLGTLMGRPAAGQRPRLHRGLRPRHGHRGGAGHRSRRAPGEAARRLRRCAHPLPGVQLHPRLRARLHAHLRRRARAGAAAVPRAGRARGRRLRAGRVPRLLVRGGGRRRRDAGPADAVRDPRELCGRRPSGSCGRAGTARGSRTARRRSRSRRPRTSTRSATSSTGLQREACLTGAAVIGPADPADQLAPVRAARRGIRCGELRARDQGAEPARPRRRASSSRSSTAARGSPPRRAARVLPLARARRSPCSPTAGSPRDGCPRLAAAGARARLRSGRAHDGRGARDVQLTRR